MTLSTGGPSVPGLGFSSRAIHYDWWLLGFLLVLPVFISAHACPRLAFVTVLLASIPQFIILHTFIARTEAGIMTFADLIAAPITAIVAYTQVVAMTLLFAGSAMWGACTPSRDRLPHDRFFV